MITQDEPLWELQLENRSGSNRSQLSLKQWIEIRHFYIHPFRDSMEAALWHHSQYRTKSNRDDNVQLIKYIQKKERITVSREIKCLNKIKSCHVPNTALSGEGMGWDEMPWDPTSTSSSSSVSCSSAEVCQWLYSNNIFRCLDLYEISPSISFRSYRKVF